ncbi:hypothetical protein [Massilia sp. TS11]|uniref:hypothetical protein n=1 Tax=Massilia sp. TS11 TaxID=2908003 RepID=UPI001ED9FED9|nr:hypothetical protein [Massilia sp. TS11]MCG2585302.1 hypothetical protein [Massilia sp. TS11]
MKTLALCAALLAASPLALADPLISSVEDQPLSELWVNPGFATYHFQRDRNLNGKNPGLGLEYRWSTQLAATAGRFKNSDWEHSNYVGVYYQPWQIGPVRLGVVGGAFNGYPHFRNGGWFPSVLPVASAEWGRLGLMTTIVPGWGERLHGGISVQLRLKLN